MKKILLIGGSPTTGKSSVARRLSEKQKLPWISTDTIRDMMRGIVRRSDYPVLFDHANATPAMAVPYLTARTSKQIVAHQNAESVEVWKGVKALVETDLEWGSFIVEGVAILPKLVARLQKRKQNIRAIFLIDENVSRVRKTIFTRGLWDDAHKYSHAVKEKEVAWVLAFNDYIKREAKKYGYPVVSITDRKHTMRAIEKVM